MADARPGYPQALEQAEKDLVGKRRENLALEEQAPVGVALSGGGIRSATFALGFFQALAGLRLLRHIDFLSTVSGGGYFGGFYGRMFHRASGDGEASPGTTPALEEIERKLRPTADGAGRREDGSQWSTVNPLRWLRENGRYLAPDGSGDLMVAGAVLLRNWVAIWVVIGSTLLSLFLGAQYARMAVDDALHRQCSAEAAPTLCAGLGPDGTFDPFVWHLPGDAILWASPLIVLPVVVLFVGVAPLGWSYWITWARDREPGWRWGFRLAATAGWCIVGAILYARGGQPATAAGESGAVGRLLDRMLATSWLTVTVELVAVVATLALVYAALAGIASRWGNRPGAPRGLSNQLARALVLTGVLLVVALMDSLGQTLYVYMKTPGTTTLGWITAVASGLGLSSAAGRKASSRWRSMLSDRVSLPVSVVAGLAALVVVVFALLCYSTAAHAITHGLETPRNAPIHALIPEGEPKPAPPPPASGADAEDPPLPGLRRLDPDDDSLLGGLLLFLATALVTGGSLSFINRSSHLPLYSARLTRAYLGASNHERRGAAGFGAVTRVHPKDDISMEAYWPHAWGNPRSPGNHHARTGAPLHFVNVTINETVSGVSNIQEQDRKGVGMALGPCGLSVGVAHHLCRKIDDDSRPLFSPATGGFRVFDVQPHATAEFETLGLGTWLGISGAAFTTGLGSRTSLGLSLLLGMANVRLGHWWNSGVVRGGDQARKALAWLGSNVFLVQRYLFGELTARFRGTAPPRWYLSDGGHFENLGVYELIRRRVPVIVVLDAGADPDYRFDDLANLIRKARVDFNTDIEFKTGTTGPGTSAMDTCLDDLRPHEADEDRSDGSLPTSNAHAAMATVHYPDDTKGRLLYVKASVVGDEPRDILQYRDEHHAFPHESTADQFFDEAQWESYRRLGQHIADVLAGNANLGSRADPEAVLVALLQRTRKQAADNTPLPRKSAPTPAPGAA